MANIKEGGKKTKIIPIMFLCFGVFCLPKSTIIGSSNRVVINEIKIGGIESSKEEYIELYNNSNVVVELNG